MTTKMNEGLLAIPGVMSCLEWLGLVYHEGDRLTEGEMFEQRISYWDTFIAGSFTLLLHLLVIGYDLNKSLLLVLPEILVLAGILVGALLCDWLFKNHRVRGGESLERVPGE